MKQWRNYQNYIIIAIISLIAVFFLPMLGSSVGIGLALPTTVAGWIVYILTKVCIVVINVLTLDQFIKQAKVNVKDNPRFIEADHYFNLNKLEEEEELLPPSRYISRIYRKRMTTVTISTILGVFGLTQAILSFDWVSMLTYLFTIVSGLVYGWITMNDVENYWTDTYYKLMEKDRHERETKASVAVAAQESLKQREGRIYTNRGADILESSDSNGNIGPVQPMVVDGGDRDNCVLGGAIYPSSSSPNSTNICAKEGASKNTIEEK